MHVPFCIISSTSQFRFFFYLVWYTSLNCFVRCCQANLPLLKKIKLNHFGMSLPGIRQWIWKVWWNQGFDFNIVKDCLSKMKYILQKFWMNKQVLNKDSMLYPKFSVISSKLNMLCLEYVKCRSPCSAFEYWQCVETLEMQKYQCTAAENLSATFCNLYWLTGSLTS